MGSKKAIMKGARTKSDLDENIRASRKLPSKTRRLSYESRFALNAVCPYFTMFPLEYPMRVLNLGRLASFKSPLVCDPYCGRGTTVFAARMHGVPAYGIDVAPVAVAIARAKVAATTFTEVMALLEGLLEECTHVDVPVGRFWEWAYDPKVLEQVCRLRVGLAQLRSSAAILLRAVMLGALHGPRAKTEDGASYFSNQMPRTFAPKPDYAVRFWTHRRRRPPRSDVYEIVRKRAVRVLNPDIPSAVATPFDIQCADSRSETAFSRLDGKITHVITSPPYYGLRTYSQDQWLREWFLGGPAKVDYSIRPGLDHRSPEDFARSLAHVWDNVGHRASPRIRLYIRFGGIRSRNVSAQEILRESLEHSVHSWRILTRHPAPSINYGKRQAVQMRTVDDPVEESDYVVRLQQ